MSIDVRPSSPSRTGKRAKYAGASMTSFQPNSSVIVPSGAWSRNTVAPGSSPTRSRIAFGMTIWPLGPTLADPEMSPDAISPAADDWYDFIARV